MRRLLLGLCCLIGFVSFADALTEQEVYDLIDDVGKKCTQKFEDVLDKIASYEQVMANGTKQQVACVANIRPKMYTRFVNELGTRIRAMKFEYKNKDSSELNPLTKEELEKTISSRLEEPMVWQEAKLKELKNCVEQ